MLCANENIFIQLKLSSIYVFVIILVDKNEIISVFEDLLWIAVNLYLSYFFDK
jgi:hypothetical protein